MVDFVGPQTAPSGLVNRGRGTRVWISDYALDRMHLPGGMVYEWQRQIAYEAVQHARFEAPVRSGALRSSIRADSELRPGRRKVGYFVRADAPYAGYVHEGTGDIFHAGMKVPKFWCITGANVPRVERDHVRGQWQQPFLKHGLEFAYRGIA